MASELIPLAPCFVTHNLALGGAQTAVLRMIRALPDWVRERTTLYCQSQDMPLLDRALASGLTVGQITTTPPEHASCYVLSYGDVRSLPKRPTSLILHSWDDEGWRYITKAYAGLRGLTVAAVSDRVHQRYQGWMQENGHHYAGVLPPPVSQLEVVRGEVHATGSIIVAWMGRPLASKGLMSLPWLLKRDPRLVVRAWTGAETAGLAYTRKVQSQAMSELLELANRLGVSDRLDLRPLDFDAFRYSHRLAGAHVLLGNSRAEGFLLTAAEALSCGIPVVVTRSCGVASMVEPGITGELIDWNEDPKLLADASYEAILRALPLKPEDCIAAATPLSLQGTYSQVHGPVLARLTGTSLQHESPRVTVGVRIHQNTDPACLDDAMCSLANQTYRQFKVVLLVDGVREYGEQLARRFNVPLICTGMLPDITHCSWLHRQALQQCDTELYKPLDYDDQLMPTYLERAVALLDEKQVDVYGCLLMTLEQGRITPRKHWPSKPVNTMFTGNSDHNQLPHSSVLMKREIALKAGNYQERAVGLGADDYHLWHRIHLAGGKFYRDDAVRNVVYRIHEKNSLKVRKARYGAGSLIAGATAASVALWAGSSLNLDAAVRDKEKKGQDRPAMQDKAGKRQPLDPPHS